MKTQFQKLPLLIALTLVYAAHSAPHKITTLDNTHCQLQSQDSEYTLHLSTHPESPIPLGPIKLCQPPKLPEEDQDDCASDGLYPFSSNGQTYVAILSHWGAHSRRLQIVDTTAAKIVHTLTGDYFIELELHPDHLIAHYDRTDQNPPQQKLRFPQ